MLVVLGADGAPQDVRPAPQMAFQFLLRQLGHDHSNILIPAVESGWIRSKGGAEHSCGSGGPKSTYARRSRQALVQDEVSFPSVICGIDQRFGQLRHSHGRDAAQRG